MQKAKKVLHNSARSGRAYGSHYDLKLSMLEEWPGCNFALGLM